MTADLTPGVRAEIPKYEIMFGWVVVPVGGHTCGMGGYGEPHEPGCGYEPVIRVERLHELLISAGILREES